MLYEGDNGYCAMVADVDVHLDTGAIHVTRLVMYEVSTGKATPIGPRSQSFVGDDVVHIADDGSHTGANPAANACLADSAFVANRFRVIQSRRAAA